MTFANFVDKLSSFVDEGVIPLLFIIAFIAFLIGIVRYFFSESDETRQKGRQFALWGLIGLVVIFSLWSIVNLFLGVLQS